MMAMDECAQRMNKWKNTEGISSKMGLSLSNIEYHANLIGSMYFIPKISTVIMLLDTEFLFPMFFPK
jgi:hypothetical protein